MRHADAKGARSSRPRPRCCELRLLEGAAARRALHAGAHRYTVCPLLLLELGRLVCQQKEGTANRGTQKVLYVPRIRSVCMTTIADGSLHTRKHRKMLILRRRLLFIIDRRASFLVFSLVARAPVEPRDVMWRRFAYASEFAAAAHAKALCRQRQRRDSEAVEGRSRSAQGVGREP